MRAAVCMCMLYRVANAWFVEAGFASRFASFAQVDLRMTFGFAFDQRPATIHIHRAEAAKKDYRGHQPRRTIL